ncbi:glycosyltransferase family 2 protein [Quadrisphaera sp. DSM 44207]|uniref:glycosyltransferase family 2 protein n=1 Tax=Quadrisphaera sp. DSM 44207 TaxID=1881057 RepID=UPI0008883322|nr:glycosyltransferase [Quadrisphaera sp. DSM 44207]SDQ68239.1 Glycosyltransferase, GT2 family [Quadrisphaera sp. DSM 44207]
MTSVVVAVLTYRRPDDLAELLPLLEEQARALHPAARVLVVDNDPAGSARSVVAASGVAATYAHEPRPGIAAARNRALDEAGDAEALVFIDDDERPGDAWLQHLVATWQETGSAGVVGPVVSRVDAPHGPWVAAGDFFRRRRLPTGSPVAVAATNNLLLDLRRVRPTGISFDERFGISGGSDTLFTRQLVAAGLQLVWCDEAVVTDVVPAHRATRGWVLRRALRSGNGWSRTSLVLATGRGRRARTRAVLTARGGVRALGGAGRFAWGVLSRSAHHRARGARTAARGLGMLTGAFGSTYAEYRRG